MNIDKVTIVNGIKLIARNFETYKKHLAENGGFAQIVEDWNNILSVVEDDYQEANNDFSLAVKVAITKNKYAPTIKEILDEMKEIRNQREEEDKRQKYIHFINLIQEYPFYRINTGVELEEAYEIYQKKKIDDKDINKAISNYTGILEIKHEKPTKPINLFLKDIDEYLKAK